MSHECQYCKKKLSTKSSLNLHQKNTTSCLDIQKSLNLSVVSLKVACEYCNDTYAKHNLSKHLLICKVKPSRELSILKEKLSVKDTELSILKEKLSDKDTELSILKEKLSVKDNELAIKDKELCVYKELAERNQVTIEKISERNQATIEELAKQNYYEYNSVIEIEQETESPEESPEEPYELVPLELDNGYIIEHREEDGYINVTNLCRAGGKKFSHWNQLDKTKAFIKALSTAAGIPAAILIQVGTGTKFGTTENTETNGTWVHPQVAINIAQWISPQFDVKVSAWVYEVMMTGKVDITNTKSYRELQQENKNKQLKIQIMTKKYVKKQPRLDIKERNVIYILTTQLMKKEGRYILGKATNLTNRLSTYNKTDEHEIVYYQEC
jgi:translation initiation factor 6 (eIF-6)